MTTMWSRTPLIAHVLCLQLILFHCPLTFAYEPPVFPPEIPEAQLDSDIFGRGHLKPFGHQHAPQGPVQEYTEELHPRAFYEDHIKPRRPLVYRQTIADSPAFQLWSDDYLRQVYGSLDVLCEVKNEDRSTTPKKMLMSEFLDRYQKDNVYIVTVLPDDMRKEVKAPHSILCGSSRRFIQEANLWVSNGGTRSLLHYDSDHNIHCLLAGRKDFVMIPKKYQSQLYMASTTLNGSGYSRVDPDSVDLRIYPLVAGIPWTWTTLLPGDCIFIPGGYLHQVRAYTRSVSETVLFTPTRWFNDSDCDSTDLGYTSLADVELKWTYVKGQKHIEMGYMNPELIRENLYSMITVHKVITKDMFFQLFFDDLRSEQYEYSRNGSLADQIWKAIKSPDREHLVRSDVEKAPLEALKDIAREVDPPHDK